MRRTATRGPSVGVVCLAGLISAAWALDVLPRRPARGAPRILAYGGTILPHLEWNKLFPGRDAAGDAVCRARRPSGPLIYGRARAFSASLR